MLSILQLKSDYFVYPKLRLIWLYHPALAGTLGDILSMLQTNTATQTQWSLKTNCKMCSKLLRRPISPMQL